MPPEQVGPDPAGGADRRLPRGRRDRRASSSGCPTAAWSRASSCAASSTEVIRTHRPDVVLSINHRDSWGGPSWNHADHRAVGPRPARRGARRRQPVGVPRSRRGLGRRAVHRLQRQPERRRTPSTSPTRSTPACDRSRATAPYLEHIGGAMASPDEFLRGGADPLRRAARRGAGRRVRGDRLAPA